MTSLRAHSTAGGVGCTRSGNVGFATAGTCGICCRYCGLRDRAVEREVEANWKAVANNFLECYHCEPAHPAFAQLVDMGSYRSTTHGIYSTGVGRSGRPDKTAFRIDPGAASQVGAFSWLWPTTTISVAPGASNMALLYLKRLGPERALEITDYYSLDTALGGQEKARIDAALGERSS